MRLYLLNNYSAMENKKNAIVLGGTVPHVTLIVKLKERGFYVILLDYLDNPPAKQYADEHLKVSTLDKELVLNIAKERKADIVISTCVDQANSVCCYVAEKLNLPHPYSYQVSLDVTDKVRMKSIMIENKVPTSRYVYVRNIEEALNQDLEYPLMVKPADSNSANGVKKVKDIDELKEYLPIALNYSRNGFAIVEEFVSGVEISAYCVIVNNKAKLLMAQERISVIEGEENTIKCYAAYAPARISSIAMGKIEGIATQIARAVHLDNTPLFFQGIVSNDNINVIEFAPRVGGGISSKTIKYSTGFDIIDAAIDSFFCIPITFSNWHSMDKIYVVNQIYGSNGYYDRTIGEKELLEDGTIDNLSFYKKKGDYIDDKRASSGRIGVMVFSATSEKEVRKKVSKAFSCIDCIDKDGKSIIRRDLNIDNLWNA